MKKKLLGWTIVAVFTGLIIVGSRSWMIFTQKKRMEDAIRSLPRLDFKFIRAGKNNGSERVIISHFFPDCTHCQYMAQKISLRKLDFLQVSVIMVTKAPAKTVDDFLAKYNLDSLPFLSIAIDTADSFYRIFGTAKVPCFFVYDKHHKLVRSVTGETSIDNLLK